MNVRLTAVDELGERWERRDEVEEGELGGERLPEPRVDVISASVARLPPAVLSCQVFRIICCCYSNISIIFDSVSNRIAVVMTTFMEWS